MPPSLRLFAALLVLACGAGLSGCATMSEKDRLVLQAQSVPAPLLARMQRHQPLDLSEIVELSRRNVPPTLIVRYIENTVAEYSLRTEDVLQLRCAGVSPFVIDYLLSTPALSAAQLHNYDPFWWDRASHPIVIHHYHRRR